MGLTRCWNAVSSRIVRLVEGAFYNLGFIVATHPWRTIALSWLLVLLSSFGLFNFYKERHPLKLWVPPSSDFLRDTEWLIDKFQVGFRPQYLLATASDVLTPHVLAELSEVNNKVNAIKGNLEGHQFSWTDICFKVPIITFYQGANNDRKRRSLNISDRSSIFDDDFFKEKDLAVSSAPSKNFDPSIDLDPSFYCGILDNMDLGCLQKSVLDIWKYNTSVIAHLRKEDIVNGINKTLTSPTLGHNLGYVDTLGGVERDENGRIISAKSVLLIWWLHVNFTNVDMEKTGNDAGTEEWASETSLEWEMEFLNLMSNLSHTVPGLNIYYEAGRTFGDISGTTMFQDMDKLAIGITLMFIYIQIILSKFKWVEVRLTLGSVGLMCVGMALVVAVSVCSMMGIPYGPVHSSLPFLIMGLGIDDMFVMKACWEQLTEADRSLPLPNQIALMLKHAGVSIIITSFTDIVAFLIGSITILPSLQAFCIYAAVGVLFVFIFSVTFYVAIFVLDCKRIEQKRNGVVLCIKHPDYVPTDPNKKSISQLVIHHTYSKVVFKLPVKIIIIVFTLAMTGYSIDGLLKLEQRFDPMWFIPEGSYFKEYVDERTKYYPDMGNEAVIYIGALNYTEEFPKIHSLVEILKNETDIVQNVETWTVPLRDYILLNFDKDIYNETLTDLDWRTYLSKFLFSPSGASYQSKFRFAESLKCGQPTSDIVVSSVDFRFKIFPGPEVYLPAMHKIKDIIRDMNFQTGDKFATVWAKVFANWVTDEIIHFEVERNLELALLCVMFCTVILITDIQICFWIFLCVLLTLVNVCGWMYRWGLTIDIVSCVGLELAIGLCVDYAAHVGHTFLVVDGTRNERAYKTVMSIGAAVLYGGGSTFLSLSVLSLSKSYIFKSFFKIFFLVISFGLFHGIVFLPVVLSIIGPKCFQHDSANNRKTNKDEKYCAQNGEQLATLNSPES